VHRSGQPTERHLERGNAFGLVLHLDSLLVCLSCVRLPDK
jgi:hypothetical protein